jgi:hypothetical protein
LYFEHLSNAGLCEPDANLTSPLLRQVHLRRATPVEDRIRIDRDDADQPDQHSAEPDLAKANARSVPKVWNLALRLRRLPETRQLRSQRPPECGARGAALDIGFKPLIVGHDVGVTEDAQHGCHHQISRGELLAIEVRLVA